MELKIEKFDMDDYIDFLMIEQQIEDDFKDGKLSEDDYFYQIQWIEWEKSRCN